MQIGIGYNGFFRDGQRVKVAQLMGNGFVEVESTTGARFICHNVELFRMDGKNAVAENQRFRKLPRTDYSIKVEHEVGGLVPHVIIKKLPRAPGADQHACHRWDI